MKHRNSDVLQKFYNVFIHNLFTGMATAHHAEKTCKHEGVDFFLITKTQCF